MSNCRPKKEIVQKQISHWYLPPNSQVHVRVPAGQVDDPGLSFDYKHWHEVGGQNNNLKLIGNGSKLEKLQELS